MAIRVDLDKSMLIRALEMAATSAQRAKNSKTANPKLAAIHDEDIRQYNVAIASLTDIK